MDRPPSASNTTTTTTTTAASTPTHKRTKSTPRTGTAPGSPALQTLYLTNLRLLDLDLLPDWPSITPTALSATDSRARIRAAEWSLYQLFRLHDPALAADKLQPFFPPLEPLQSINLRAALYRCLDGLKKNGVLGREAVLRKTMLDECAGDKFWEACVAFSAVVLRQRVLARRGRSGYEGALGVRLGLAQGLGRAEREVLAPLVLAHRVGLGGRLAERRKLGEEFAQLEGLLRGKEEELAERREVLRRAEGGEVERRLGELRPLEDALRKGWAGDDGVRDAVLSGGDAASGDKVLVDSTESLFDRDSAAGSPVRKDVGLVEDIEVKARGQSLRMKRWQALYDKIQAAKPKPSPEEEARARGGSVTIRFDKHSDLTLADAQQQRGSTSPTKSSHSRAASAHVVGYDNILSAMREELRRAQNARRNGNASPKDARHNRSMSDAISGARRSSSFQSAHSRQHSHSPSQSPAPFRPGMGRRVSSRSRSYHQPKVISQRGPIPLKTELFSPLKTARPGNESPNSAYSASTSRPPSALPTPHEEGDESFSSIEGTLDDSGRQTNSRSGRSFRGNSILPSPQEAQFESPTSIDAALGNSVRHERSQMDGATSVNGGLGFALPERSASSVVLDPPKQDLTYDDSEITKPSLPPTQHTHRPSLADRTRSSMAFTSSENTRNLIPTTNSPNDPPSPAITTSNFPLPPSNITRTPLPTSPDNHQQPLTLADRTLQSISASNTQSPSPNATPRRNPSKHTRSRTSLHTPTLTTPRVRRSSVGSLSPSREEEDGTGTGKRAITPREQLFEASAEYDSVFKSRPRVAHSPVMSPSLLEGGEEEMSMIGALRGLDDDEGELGSSPLRR